MDRHLMAPVFMDEAQFKLARARERARIVRVTHFGDVAPDRAPAGKFLFSSVAAPAIGRGADDSRQYEVMLAPPGTTVRYELTRAVFGWIQESTWPAGTLIRLTLPEESSLYDAARAGYRYLFRRQQVDRRPALRYTNYVPRLLESDEARTTQRYVSFNAGRYHAWALDGPKRIRGQGDVTYAPVTDGAWRPVAPAATGIGANEGPLVIEAWYAGTTSARVEYVQNSRQTAPFDYERRYGTTPPIFARGTYVATPDGAGMIVSGTASVLGSEVVHDPGEAGRDAGDADILESCLRRQVSVTCDNIAHLLSADNLARQGIDDGLDLTDLRAVRVYVKHHEHVDAARQEVARRLGDTAALFVRNDVCRPGWLVEIEGTAWRSA